MTVEELKVQIDCIYENRKINLFDDVQNVKFNHKITITKSKRASAKLKTQKENS